MILDNITTLSAIDVGDLPTLVQDTGSTYSYDQGVKGASFSAVAAGGVYSHAPFVVVRLSAACTSGTSAATVQVVLQHSADNITFTDLVASPAYTIADCVQYAVLLAVRIPQASKRYVRVAYRIGTEVLTAGTFQSLIVLDADMQDLFMRGATQTVSMPTGAFNQVQGASAAGVLDT